jgi:hypothetical protein
MLLLYFSLFLSILSLLYLTMKTQKCINLVGMPILKSKWTRATFVSLVYLLHTLFNSYSLNQLPNQKYDIHKEGYTLHNILNDTDAFNQILSDTAMFFPLISEWVRTISPSWFYSRPVCLCISLPQQHKELQFVESEVLIIVVT